MWDCGRLGFCASGSLGVWASRFLRRTFPRAAPELANALRLQTKKCKKHNENAQEKRKQTYEGVALAFLTPKSRSNRFPNGARFIANKSSNAFCATPDKPPNRAVGAVSHGFFAFFVAPALKRWAHGVLGLWIPGALWLRSRG